MSNTEKEYIKEMLFSKISKEQLTYDIIFENQFKLESDLTRRSFSIEEYIEKSDIFQEKLSDKEYANFRYSNNTAIEIIKDFMEEYEDEIISCFINEVGKDELKVMIEEGYNKSNQDGLYFEIEEYLRDCDSFLKNIARQALDTPNIHFEEAMANLGNEKYIFKQYFYDFYDDRPELKVSDKEFDIIYSARLRDKTIEFCGDSTDREIMRDLILNHKGLDPQGFDIEPSDHIVKAFDGAVKTIKKDIHSFVSDLVSDEQTNKNKPKI